MSIIASAPVPESSRLTDADTADLAAIRRTGTNAGRFPVNGTYVSQSAATTPALLDAASPEFRDGYARGYADALGRVSDADLLTRAAAINPAGVRRLAENIRSGACPPWCSYDHRAEVTSADELDADGFSLGLVHERVMVELTGLDPATTTDPATATVYVESTTEAGENGPEVITAPRVVLTVAEGPSGDFAGGEGVQGWTGTPAEARALAAALLAAAELVDGGNR
ncbi:hypothetical protein AB0N38_11710 [Micromonospora aurantiaca]|uniref:hypothetical protein n=1 Tax=Micromonospora aurantiaca (nom. illeg.) TaxID=47850 RepID=UPI0034412CBF